MFNSSRNNGRKSPKTPNNKDSRSDSSKIGKAAAQQYYEKYITMADESMTMSDRIAAEYCYQHAEHYWRLLSELKTLESGTEPVA
ncbi:MAG: DUF4167 domain-containing protein [Alphaproteobacteria bacterium]